MKSGERHGRFQEEDEGMFYLAMALFWLVSGVAIIFWQRTHPESAAFYIAGTRISLGWPVFALVVYNLARWYRIRSAARRRTEESSWQQRQHPDRRTSTEPEHRPDPNFDLGEKKPPS